MPTFNNEKEFNKYFEKETNYTNKFRNKDGIIEFSGEDFQEEFNDFMSGLLSLDDSIRKTKITNVNDEVTHVKIEYND
jgi:hypothetical protein